MISERKITDGRTITETDLIMFSYFTGDWTFLHTDKEKAEKSMFGERVAHGYLTLSVSLGLMIRAGIINNEVFMALKSIEKVNFLKPVKIGDTLTVSFIENRRKSSKPEIVVVTTSAETYNQKNERVMEFTVVYLEKSN